MLSLPQHALSLSLSFAAAHPHARRVADLCVEEDKPSFGQIVDSPPLPGWMISDAAFLRLPPSSSVLLQTACLPRWSAAEEGPLIPECNFGVLHAGLRTAGLSFAP